MAPVLMWLLALLSVCGIAFYLIALGSAWTYARRSPAATPTRWPSVSILKPLRGADPQMYESFRSHCEQDYPGDHEIIFAVGSAEEPAVALVERLRREFPHRNIRLVTCSERLGANGKVSALLQMLPHARHQHILVNDSDIEVEPDYLRQTMREFSRADTGLVTALYRARAGRSFWSMLEAIGISTDFAPGVLTARQLESGLHFALGSTLAFTREALAQAGGLEPLLDHLADDYELGERISRAGLRVTIADTVVETHLPAYSAGDFFRHQLRWGRTLRASRPAGFASMFLSFGFFWTLLLFLLAPATGWTFILMAAALVSRGALGIYVGRVLLQDEQVIRWMPLMFARDLLYPVIWLASLFGNTVMWRGERFRLRGKKLERT